MRKLRKLRNFCEQQFVDWNFHSDRKDKTRKVLHDEKMKTLGKTVGCHRFKLNFPLRKMLCFLTKTCDRRKN